MPLKSQIKSISESEIDKLLESLSANNFKLNFRNSTQTADFSNTEIELKYCYNSDKIFNLIGKICVTEGFNESLTIFLKFLLEIKTIEAAAIWLYNEDRLELLSQDSRQKDLLKVLNQSLYQKVCKQLIIENVVNSFSMSSPSIAQLCHPQNKALLPYVSEILCIPLVHFGEIQGVLTLFTKDAIFHTRYVNWFKRIVPMVATLMYKHKLSLTATSKERALSLLLRETEILVRAQSEEELLREAGEMAMEILFLESGFFLMQQEDKSWHIRSPFGFLHDSNDPSWQSEIEQFIKEPSFEHPKTFTIIHTERDLPGLGSKILVYPVVTHSGIVGHLWLGNFNEKLFEQNQEILAALVRGVGVALETIRQREQLELIAMTDPLTGIFNRQGFEKRIKEEMAAAIRRRSSFLLLVLDLDGFKLINDTKGHPVGDYVLKQIAHVIKKSVRVQDIVARTGGDEFAVVLTDISLDKESLAIIERVQKQICSSHLGLGVSIGVAEFPHEASTYDMLYKIADQRLYVGKGTGKGKIIMK